MGVSKAKITLLTILSHNMLRLTRALFFVDYKLVIFPISLGSTGLLEIGVSIYL